MVISRPMMAASIVQQGSGQTYTTSVAAYGKQKCSEFDMSVTEPAKEIFMEDRWMQQHAALKHEIMLPSFARMI